MTLRGSIAAFPLETIVQLLAATAKTGQLEIRSAAERGTLGFAEGRLVSAASGDDGGDSALGAVFALSEGEFEFIGWNEAPAANLSGDLNELLDRAVVQRDKIAGDRAIIANDRMRFALSDRAAASGEVRLSADQWKALLAVNGERDVNGIAAHLGTGRFATLAMLADLVRAGIVELREAPAEPEPPTTGTKMARDDRSDAPAAPDAPAAAEPARSWSAPVAPTEPRSWDRPAAPERPSWDRPAEPERPSWDRPAEPERPAWDRPTEPERPSWDGPAETARDWGTPTAPDAPAAPAAWEAADPVPASAPRTESAPPALDERLAALSSLPDQPSGPVAARPSAAVAPPAEPPAAEARAVEPPARDAERPAVDAPSELPADAPRRKGGLFAGLFKRDEPAGASRETGGVAPAAESRIAALAALANGLLDEYGNGQYGKGRIDDRMANLLLRADEQADPIDRALPVTGDRIDVAALEHAGLNDRQVAPYLALLVSQIYEDAGRAFGHDRARRGYKSVHQKVVGDAATLGSDLRLPRV